MLIKRPIDIPRYPQVLGLLLVTLGLLAIPPAEAQPTSQLHNIFRRIFDQDEDDPPLISRGDICLIAPATPGAGTPAIWHDQPVMVFKPGSIERLALREEATNVVFWDYSPTVTTSHVIYDGAPLQSDQVYRLDVYLDADAPSPAIFPDFHLLSEDTRSLISQGLAIGTTPDDTDALPADWDAIQRAEYFVEQGLRLDAIQALFAVENPSAELVNTQRRIIASACD